MSIRGLVVDPVPNSLNLCDKNCMANSKENYQWDLSNKRVEKRGKKWVDNIRTTTWESCLGILD